MGQTDLTVWANGTSLKFKGEFALAAIGNDLFSGPSLLRDKPPLGYFLHALRELSIPQRPACVRPLGNDRKPERPVCRR